MSTHVRSSISATMGALMLDLLYIVMVPTLVLDVLPKLSGLGRFGDF